MLTLPWSHSFFAGSDFCVFYIIRWRFFFGTLQWIFWLVDLLLAAFACVKFLILFILSLSAVHIQIRTIQPSHFSTSRCTFFSLFVLFLISIFLHVLRFAVDSTSCVVIASLACYVVFNFFPLFFFSFIPLVLVISHCVSTCYVVCVYILFFSVFCVVSVIHCSYIYFMYFWCALPRCYSFCRALCVQAATHPLALLLPSFSTVSFDFVQFTCEQCVCVAVSGILFIWLACRFGWNAELTSPSHCNGFIWQITYTVKQSNVIIPHASFNGLNVMYFQRLMPLYNFFISAIRSFLGSMVWDTTNKDWKGAIKKSLVYHWSRG